MSDEALHKAVKFHRSFFFIVDDDMEQQLTVARQLGSSGLSSLFDLIKFNYL